MNLLFSHRGLQSLCHPQKVNSSLQRTQSSHIPSYQSAFNLVFQLARLQLLRESIPSNWQLASCALAQLAGIWGFPPHPTHLRPLTPDAIKDCSRLFPLGSNEKESWEVGAAKCGKSLLRAIYRNKTHELMPERQREAVIMQHLSVISNSHNVMHRWEEKVAAFFFSSHATFNQKQLLL